MNLQLLVCFLPQECNVDRFRHQQCEAHNTDSTKYRPHFLGGNNIKFAWGNFTWRKYHAYLWLQTKEKRHLEKKTKQNKTDTNTTDCDSIF